MKNCSNSNCPEINPQIPDRFSKDVSRKDGLMPYCKACNKTRSILRKKEILEYRSRNKERLSALQAQWYKHHKEKHSLYMKIYKKKNKIEIARQTLLSRQANPGKVNARNRKRQIFQIKATLPWLTNEHFVEIEKIYTEAARLTKETGIAHHVDHIVPLMAVNEAGERIASGLHVHYNLRVVPADQNLRDGNKLINKGC